MNDQTELYTAPVVPERTAAPPASIAGKANRSHRATSLGARGEPFVWLLGAGQIAAVLMIVALLALILVQGLSTFWPKDLVLVTLGSGQKFLGEITRSELYRPAPAAGAAADA